jgi:uncharacterized coiled-coil DUF342 family protein
MQPAQDLAAILAEVQDLRTESEAYRARAAEIAGESQPWDAGTLQLLKTIHIEKNATG